MSGRLRKKCRKLLVNKLKLDNEDHKIYPVAASSPNSSDDLDQQDEEVVKEAKKKLEDIKKEVSRQARLVKFKLGSECIKLKFDKSIFAKNVYQCYQQGLADKSSNTISGLSTLSFTNAASSTATIGKIQDKNTSYELRNKKTENLKQLKSAGISIKEVTFCETMCEVPKNKYLLTSHSDERLGGVSSNNSTSRIGLSKKQGSGRAVAIVTPGPEVNRPLSVLRRPTAGELAISLFGSPLLVAPDCASTTMPQINLPTADGNVVAILPREGFTIEDMPQIATPTRHQLKTLNKYLNDLCLQHERI